MSQDQNIDLDKLIADRIERGVADVSICLENKKLGDDEIIRLAEMEILAEMTHLDLGENDISDRGLSALCNSPFIKNLKVLNLKSNICGISFIIIFDTVTQMPQIIFIHPPHKRSILI